MTLKMSYRGELWLYRPDVVVVELEGADDESQLEEGEVAQVVQAGVRDAQRDVGVRGEARVQRVTHLREGRDALARDEHGAALGSARARRDLAALGAVQGTAHGEAQQRVEERRHGGGEAAHRKCRAS